MIEINALKKKIDAKTQPNKTQFEVKPHQKSTEKRANPSPHSDGADLKKLESDMKAAQRETLRAQRELEAVKRAGTEDKLALEEMRPPSLQ